MPKVHTNSCGEFLQPASQFVSNAQGCCSDREPSSIGTSNFRPLAPCETRLLVTFGSCLFFVAYCHQEKNALVLAMAKELGDLEQSKDGTITASNREVYTSVAIMLLDGFPYRGHADFFFNSRCFGP